MARNSHIPRSTPGVDIEKGEQAERLMENPVLVEALDKLEGEYLKAWRDSPLNAVEMRETAFVMVRAVDRLRQQLNEFATNGKIERDSIRKTLTDGSKK